MPARPYLTFRPGGKPALVFDVIDMILKYAAEEAAKELDTPTLLALSLTGALARWYAQAELFHDPVGICPDLTSVRLRNLDSVLSGPGGERLARHVRTLRIQPTTDLGRPAMEEYLWARMYAKLLTRLSHLTTVVMVSSRPWLAGRLFRFLNRPHARLRLDSLTHYHGPLSLAALFMSGCPLQSLHISDLIELPPSLAVERLLRSADCTKRLEILSLISYHTDTLVQALPRVFPAGLPALKVGTMEFLETSGSVGNMLVTTRLPDFLATATPALSVLQLHTRSPQATSPEDFAAACVSFHGRMPSLAYLNVLDMVAIQVAPEREDVELWTFSVDLQRLGHADAITCTRTERGLGSMQRQRS